MKYMQLAWLLFSNKQPMWVVKAKTLNNMLGLLPTTCWTPLAAQSYAHNRAKKVQTRKLIAWLHLDATQLFPQSPGRSPFFSSLHPTCPSSLSLIARRGICFLILIPHTKGGWITSFLSCLVWIDPLQQMHAIQKRAIKNNGSLIFFHLLVVCNKMDEICFFTNFLSLCRHKNTNVVKFFLYFTHKLQLNINCIPAPSAKHLFVILRYECWGSCLHNFLLYTLNTVCIYVSGL